MIIRLDFMNYIESNVVFNEKIQQLIQRNFSRKGMQQIIKFHTMDLILDNDKTTTNKDFREGLQQEFKDFQDNKLIISNKFLILTINNYSRYEDEINKILPVFKELMSNGDLMLNRVGIRYINIFDDNKMKPQKNYFNSQIASFMDTRNRNNELIKPIRVMALNQYNVDNMRLDFRYGQYNKEYPRPINNTSFVLDYDCYSEELIENCEDLERCILQGHKAIQFLFEDSITDKLRKVMNDG